jgi:hypothetical protein
MNSILASHSIIIEYACSNDNPLYRRIIMLSAIFNWRFQLFFYVTVRHVIEIVPYLHILRRSRFNDNFGDETTPRL